MYNLIRDVSVAETCEEVLLVHTPLLHAEPSCCYPGQGPLLVLCKFRDEDNDMFGAKAYIGISNIKSHSDECLVTVMF